MYIKIKNKKIKLQEANTFWERFKGLKFILEPIDYGIRFPHKKFSTTNFLCQRIDIVLTDKEDKILYLFNDVGTEKYIFPRFKVYYTYFLPLGVASKLKVGDKLNVILEKDDEKKEKEKEEN